MFSPWSKNSGKSLMTLMIRNASTTWDWEKIYAIAQIYFAENYSCQSAEEMQSASSNKSN